MTDNKFLNYICLIRLVITVLLVMYHSFAPYCGAWENLPFNHLNIELFSWIAFLAYSFMLEAFVFMSGYLFGYQTNKNPGGYNKSVILSKIKRLLIPSIIFSFAYLLIIRNQFEFTPEYIYKIVSGVGHLWFLPMLFWCFIITILLDITGFNPKILFMIVIFLTLGSLLNLPIRINQSCNYMLFFFSGFAIKRYNVKFEPYASPRFIILAGALFICSAIVGISLKSVFPDGSLFAKIIKFTYAAWGVIAIFISAYYATELKGVKISSKNIAFSNCCFGVYILQEFIIRSIYYKSSISLYISPYILPWLTLGLTLFVSIFLTCIARKTKVGRFILG